MELLRLCRNNNQIKGRDPFIARDVPLADESLCVIHFRDRERHDFPDMLRRIPDAFMSRPGTLVIPSKSLRLALGVICGPILAGFMDARGAATSHRG